MNHLQKIVEIAFSCGTIRQYRANTLMKIPFFNDVFTSLIEEGHFNRNKKYYLPMLHTTFTKVINFAETRDANCMESDSDYIVLIELLVMFHFLTKSEAIDRIATRMTGGCVGSTEARLPRSRHSSESGRVLRRNSSTSTGSSKSRKDFGLSELYVPRWDPIDSLFLKVSVVSASVRGHQMFVPYNFLHERCPKYFDNVHNPMDNESLSEDRCIRIQNEVEHDNFIDMEPECLGHLIEYLSFPGLSQLPVNFDIYCQNVIGFNPEVPPRNNLLNQRLKLF